MAYRYQEKISFHPVIKILYLAMLVLFAALLLRGEVDMIATVVLLPLVVAIALLFGRLVIDVDEDTLTTSFGYLGWPVQKIPLSQVENVEVVSYKPLRQFGGWGIRCGSFQGQRTSCYSMRGDRGVLLSVHKEIRVCMTKTHRFLIGSQTPESLAQALGS